MLPLQKMCLIRISTTLCNNRQLLSLISKCYFFQNFYYRLHMRKSKEWEAVLKKANEMILKMCKSIFIRDLILEFIWPVSYKILLWNFTYGTYKTDESLQLFYWTDKGRIDNKRTAKLIIDNKNIPVRERFRLACGLCLCKEIHEMWCELSKSDKQYFTRKKRDKFDPLILFWAHFMNQSVGVVSKYMCRALECAIKNGLSEATKHLFSLLMEGTNDLAMKSRYEVRCLMTLNDKIISNSFLDEDEIEIARLILTEFEFSEIILKSFQLLPLSVLLHNSEDSFLRILQIEMKYCCEHDIETLLRYIFNMYHFEVVQDNDYAKLFIDVWREIPVHLRNSVARETDLGPHCLRALIRHDFPFLLSEEIIEKMTDVVASDPRYNILRAPPGYPQVKWEFLLFLINEEVVTVASTKIMLRFFRKSDSNALKRVMKFVRKFT